MMAVVDVRDVLGARSVARPDDAHRQLTPVTGDATGSSVSCGRGFPSRPRVTATRISTATTYVPRIAQSGASRTAVYALLRAIRTNWFWAGVKLACSRMHSATLCVRFHSTE